jgi:hypothetical protein
MASRTSVVDRVEPQEPREIFALAQALLSRIAGAA